LPDQKLMSIECFIAQTCLAKISYCHAATHCKHTATHCKHTATHCKHTATHCNTLQQTTDQKLMSIEGLMAQIFMARCIVTLQNIVLFCKRALYKRLYSAKETYNLPARCIVTLQRTANILQHTVTHCNTL